MRPKIRKLETFAVPGQDRDRIGLRDAGGLVPQGLLVGRQMLPIIALMDGDRTLEQIQSDFEEHYGAAVGIEVLQQIVEALDDALFLESPRFEQYEEAQRTAYREGGVRAAQYAGEEGVYSDDPDVLRRELLSFYTSHRGPGRPDKQTQRHVRALMAPQREFQRAGHGYAHAYAALAGAEPAETYILLGTNHFGHGAPFTLTRCAFETPLGRVEVDQKVVDELVNAGGSDVLKDELAHKHEYALELQVVFLQHLREMLGLEAPWRIVPVLCGDGMDEENDEVPQAPPMQSFVDALVNRLDREGDRFCVIAGVDLCDIGPRTGEQGPLTMRLLRKLERADRDTLRLLMRGDADGYFRMIADEQNRRHASWLSCYTLLRAAHGLQPQLLRYDQAVERAGENPHAVVSFAGAAFG